MMTAWLHVVKKAGMRRIYPAHIYTYIHRYVYVFLLLLFLQLYFHIRFCIYFYIHIRIHIYVFIYIWHLIRLSICFSFFFPFFIRSLILFSWMYAYAFRYLDGITRWFKPAELPKDKIPERTVVKIPHTPKGCGFLLRKPEENKENDNSASVVFFQVNPRFFFNFDPQGRELPKKRDIYRGVTSSVLPSPSPTLPPPPFRIQGMG